MTRGQVVWLLWDDLWGDDRMLWGVYSTGLKQYFY